MSNSSIDPRIIPLVRSLKDQSIKPTKNNIQDISSEKTSENSAKFKENQKIEEEKDSNNKKEDKPRKSKGNIRLREKSNTMVKKKLSTKISIDGSVDNKLIKTGTAENHRHQANSSNKIKIISKNKEQKFNFTNAFQSPSNLINKKDKDNYNYNKIKTRTKYVQNLLSDMSIKKYKQSCIDLIKNDNTIKKLYEQAGFEKTNFSYEIFIQNNFFDKPLFMYKLEMLFLDENNFNKKNFKENFFKNEMVKYLEHLNSQEIYKTQMNSLKNVFQDGFKNITDFDLFHD
jgi:hypothetical protein